MLESLRRLGLNAWMNAQMLDERADECPDERVVASIGWHRISFLDIAPTLLRLRNESLRDFPLKQSTFALGRACARSGRLT
jgi:hypothetical protein